MTLADIAAKHTTIRSALKRAGHTRNVMNMIKHLAAGLALALVLCLSAPAMADAATAGEKEVADQIAQYEKRAKKTSSGLKYVVLREGKGEKPSKGQLVDTHYVGRLLNGKMFDQSSGRGPFSFNVGTGKVIKAWDEALLDMKLGEKRALIVPPALGYGAKGAGGLIPPNATLYFEVERLR